MSIIRFRTSQLLAMLLATILIVVTIPFALATDSQYKIELVVPSGTKSKETDAVLTFKDKTFSVIPYKKKFKASGKELKYTDVTQADYSRAKKPMLSGGGAVATALLVGLIFAIPFLFVKKKKHWIVVRTEDEFVVLKLKKNNYRAIIAEFETHKVEVTTVVEEKKK